MAKKLTDSAVSVVHSYDYKNAISLLNQAIEIDSDYVSAYSAKFNFLQSMKPTDKNDLLATILKLIKFKPLFPELYLNAGIIYIQNGDSLSAIKFLSDAEIHFDKLLDTMHKSNSAYEPLIRDKVFCLILEGKEQKGHDLLREFSELEKDSNYRNKMTNALNKSRKEIIDSLKLVN